MHLSKVLIKCPNIIVLAALVCLCGSGCYTVKQADIDHFKEAKARIQGPMPAPQKSLLGLCNEVRGDKPDDPAVADSSLTLQKHMAQAEPSFTLGKKLYKGDVDATLQGAKDIEDLSLAHITIAFESKVFPFDA